jgi:hypothetical protein
MIATTSHPSAPSCCYSSSTVREIDAVAELLFDVELYPPLEELAALDGRSAGR